MSSRSVGTNGNLQDVKQLLEQINKLCGKIRVANKETSQLAELCDTLNDLVDDRSLISQEPNYDDIKRDLVEIEEQLTGWSKFSCPKSLMKRAQIKAGVIGFVEMLEVISQATGDQGTHTPGEGSSEAQVPPLHPQETQDIQSVQANEARRIERLDGQVTKIIERPYAGGPVCEVWEGQWVKQNGEGRRGGVEKVALKTLQTKSYTKARETLERELPRWHDLRHKNILPFYGIVTDLGPRLYMISPWQENGNLLVYVKATPQPNKNYLLRGSASGLSYLHSRGIVHGSVKCNNVLVSSKGEPRVCDFEIERIWEEVNETTILRTVTSGGHVRYLAPEYIGNDNFRATMRSDTYSFGMLILECMTEEVPFSNITRDAMVLHARTHKGQHPSRPNGRGRNRISDDLWRVMMNCWEVVPEKRPTMEEVLNFFLR